MLTCGNSYLQNYLSSKCRVVYIKLHRSEESRRLVRLRPKFLVIPVVHFEAAFTFVQKKSSFFDSEFEKKEEHTESTMCRNFVVSLMSAHPCGIYIVT